MSSNSNSPMASEEEYVVQQGDCISSIATVHGHFWETVWNHPGNRQLKSARKDPNVLLPGDTVFIPAIRQKEHPAATDRCHRFVKKGVPAMLRVRLMEFGRPLANEPYVVVIDGIFSNGTTDSQGRLELEIPPGARQGTLLLRQGRTQYELNLGHIDPIDQVAGVQERLRNLGFDCGPVDGVSGPRTEAALIDFQRQNSLPTTGQADQATRDALQKAYGA